MLVSDAPGKTAALSRSEKAATTAPGLPPHPDHFVRRHIGPSEMAAKDMLAPLGYATLDELIDRAVPSAIRLARPLELPAPKSEHEVLAALKELASQNQVFRSFIGMGYYDCITPAVIQRNIL